MSGASGRIPSAIHVTPEAQDQGPIARIVSGDLIEVDLANGVLRVVSDDEAWKERASASCPPESLTFGRGLFGFFRQQVSGADAGAAPFWDAAEH
jgi:phosphogluconate dehydratase